MSFQFSVLFASRIVPILLLVLLPIVHWSGGHGPKVYLFDLAQDHKLITSEYYNHWVWAAAFVLPVTSALLIAFTVAGTNLKSHRAVKWDIAVLLLSTWAVFIIVLPQAVSFGTDAKPLSFDEHPNWTVYMAIAMPLGVSVLHNIFVYNQCTARLREQFSR